MKLLVAMATTALLLLGLQGAASAANTSDLTPDPLVAGQPVTATLNIDVDTATTADYCEFYTQVTYTVTYLLTSVEDPNQTIELVTSHVYLNDGTNQTATVVDNDVMPSVAGDWTVEKTVSTAGSLSDVPNPNYNGSTLICGRFTATSQTTSSIVTVAEDATVPVAHLPTLLSLGAIGMAGMVMMTRRRSELELIANG